MVALQIAFSYETLVEGSVKLLGVFGGVEDEELPICGEAEREEDIAYSDYSDAYVDSCAGVWDGLWDSASPPVKAGTSI